MVLVYLRIGSGKTRVCNANCYDAKKEKCSCICGGRNHGGGLKKALENIDQKFKDISTESFKDAPVPKYLQMNLDLKP